jgi:hypothetical protein
VSEFKFNPADVTPQTPVEVDAEPTPSRIANFQTDAERIANANARAMAACKANNLPGALYGFEYDESYFQDFSGPETSLYAFDGLLGMLCFLHDPKWQNANVEYNGGYDPRTGVWTRGNNKSPVPIQELKDAVKNRIAALGLREVLLAEYLAEIHGVAASQVFWNLDFAARMEMFRRRESL